MEGLLVILVALEVRLALLEVILLKKLWVSITTASIKQRVDLSTYVPLEVNGLDLLVVFGDCFRPAEEGGVTEGQCHRAHVC